MSITLRSVKGTALTYEELDNNISQLIYSASIEPGAGPNTHNIVLYYTGSVSPLLQPRTATVLIPPTPTSNLQAVTTVGNTTTLSITANSFIKTGGTVDQVLLGTGATSPLIFTTGSGIASIQPNSNLYSSRATGNYSFAFGGQDNHASGNYSLAGAGVDNTASGNYSTVLGGEDNTAEGYSSFIGGGENNELSTDSSLSAIIGGQLNEIIAATGSVILGGRNNEIASTHHRSSILAGENVTTTRSDTAFAPSVYASGSTDATDASGIFQLSLRSTPPTSPEDGMLMWSGSAANSSLYFRRTTGFTSLWEKVDFV